MKKITLLFAALLAMFGNAFGQKEGKVLWENVVDTIDTGAYVNDVGGPVLSPSGSILVRYNWFVNSNTSKAGVKTYDKNGKLSWNSSDFYRTPSNRIVADIENKTHTLINSEYTSTRINGIEFDSTLYFDKDLKFLRRFFVNNPSAFLINVEDGVFHNNIAEKTLIKYNALGKEEWRYDSPDPIAILSKKSPYFGQPFSAPLDKRPIFIFDKNGKKIATTELFYLTRLIATTDKGFWAQTGAYEYIKFDSTGKQTAKFSDSKGIFVDFSDTTLVLRDNSLLLSFIKDTEVSFVKVSASGKVKNYSIPANIKFKDYYKTFIYKVLYPENKIMYSLRLQDIAQAEADIKYKIGVVDLNNPSDSWSKEVLSGASNGLYGNAFSFEAGNTFFQVVPSPTNPDNKSFRAFDIKGDLKWDCPYSLSSPIQISPRWKIIDNYVYFVGTHKDSLSYNNGSFYKVRFTDGKIIWGKKYDAVHSFVDYINKDSKGNDVIFYRSDFFQPDKSKSEFIYTFKTAVLNDDGSINWAYTFDKVTDYNAYPNPSFISTDDGKLVVLTREKKDNKQQYILRKISPCGDLNAISITANKTEACPTEKIKLSIPKQEGVTYQWQKDGIDLPNLKDVVYDFGESGTYTVTAKDETCQNQAVSNALKINIRSLATAQITAPKSTFCEGDKTVIAAQTNGTLFQWQKEEKDIPNATSGIYEATQTGNYRVGVRDDKCPQVGFSNVFTINVKPTPEAKISTNIVGIIYEPFTVKMTANTGTGLSYQWLKDDVIIPNETTANYEAKKSGKYNVSVTKDGCVKTSEALNISILIPLANSQEIGEEQVQIYPNPSRGTFNLILPKTLQNADIQLFDIIGRERSLIHTGEQARAEGLPKGTYFLRVSKGEKVVTNKLIIE